MQIGNQFKQCRSKESQLMTTDWFVVFNIF